MLAASRTVARRAASVRTYKELAFGNAGRQKMLAGVEQLGRAVAVTLGPKGRTVIIDQAFGPPKVRRPAVRQR